MGLTPAELEQAGADYRAAKAAITEHRIRQAAAEVALTGLLKANRDAAGRPLPDIPEIVEARDAVDRAVADVEWCKALTVACGEIYKSESFADVLKRNAVNGRPDTARLVDRSAPVERSAPVDRGEG